MRTNDNISSPAISQKPASNDWPALVTRIIDDLTRIIQTEIGLFQAGLEPILSGAIDRFLASMLALLALVLGAVCLLAAFAVYLHFRLGWAAALAITGGVSVAAGLVAAYGAKLRGGRTRAKLERTFSRSPVRSGTRP